MSRFWEFAQLSDKYKGLDAMNQIPQEPRLYVGGLKALDNPDALAAAKITHILSVIEYDACDWEEFQSYQRLWVQIEDAPQENILKRFQQTNEFLDAALSNGGIVLVHCAMGISRSATILCAYLMHRNKLNPQQALEVVREGRPFCIPNDGFVDQLEVYGRILTAGSHDEATRLYEEWEAKKNTPSKF